MAVGLGLVGSIVQTFLHEGQAQAQGDLAQGQIWANTFQNIGKLGAAAVNPPPSPTPPSPTSPAFAGPSVPGAPPNWVGPTDLPPSNQGLA